MHVEAGHPITGIPERVRSMTHPPLVIELPRPARRMLATRSRFMVELH